MKCKEGKWCREALHLKAERDDALKRLERIIKVHGPCACEAVGGMCIKCIAIETPANTQAPDSGKSGEGDSCPATKCQKCGLPHGLSELDAGSDRECDRLCLHCYEEQDSAGDGEIVGARPVAHLLDIDDHDDCDCFDGNVCSSCRNLYDVNDDMPTPPQPDCKCKVCVEDSLSNIAEIDRERHPDSAGDGEE